MNAGPHNLLVCTVGGSQKPIVESILHWKPDRVFFVTSAQTRSQVDTVLDAYAEETESPLSPGQYDVKVVPDAEDLIGCVTAIRELERDVTDWATRPGADYAVVVDFTAGTKCMTAALALVSQRWPCRYAYVGGERRTKEGVGVVENGSERVVDSANPWDALGYRAVEDFVVLFDQRAFAAAANTVEEAKKRIDDRARKREMSALEHLARAFDAWDRFDHKKGKAHLEDVAKQENDLCAALGDHSAKRLKGALPTLKAHIDSLVDTATPSLQHVIDLLANAKRRREEGRFDDAVARLYRAIEALAQVALKERHGIESTEKVPLDRLPESLRPQWTSKAEEGVVMLGLQDAYTLLASLNDPLGEAFRKQELNGTKSPLTARNRSILAHGFDRVGENVFNPLWKAALALADMEEAKLPSFPRLGDSPQHGR